MIGNKSDLRKALLRKRKELGRLARQRGSRRIAAAVGALRQFKPGARVAAYLSFGSEVDSAPVMRIAKRRGIAIHVPLVVDRRRRRMLFVPLDGRIKPGTLRTIGYPAGARHIPSRWFNLILIPVVGIDARGSRLGMGAGFFDRALAFRRQRRHWMGPRLVGLAFDCQRVESIHPQVWDARLDAIISESGLHGFLKR
jgi:5-formyltetrahydrofolate cyclo-ligase